MLTFCLQTPVQTPFFRAKCPRGVPKSVPENRGCWRVPLGPRVGNVQKVSREPEGHSWGTPGTLARKTPIAGRGVRNLRAVYHGWFASVWLSQLIGEMPREVGASVTAYDS